MENGKAVMVNRIGTWVAILGMAAYVFNMGQWVGAADEKFIDAQTVEEKQTQLILDVNTLTTEQTYTKEAVVANKLAIEQSRREILAAIEKIKDE